MTRIKLVAVSAIAAVMILGSTIVFASAPAADSSDTSADQSAVTTELRADPVPFLGQDDRVAGGSGGEGGRASSGPASDDEDVCSKVFHFLNNFVVVIS